MFRSSNCCDYAIRGSDITDSSNFKSTGPHADHADPTPREATPFHNLAIVRRRAVGPGPVPFACHAHFERRTERAFALPPTRGGSEIPPDVSRARTSRNYRPAAR